MTAKEYATEKLNEAGFKREVAEKDFDLIIKACEGMATQTEYKRGLFFTGSVGCGKTMALKALRPNARFFDLTDRDSQDFLQPFERFFTEGSAIKWWVIDDQKEIILDDIGNEPIKNDYGVKIDIVGSFILQWYNRSFKAGMNIRLNATTNLSDVQLVERYGARVVDRLFEMVDIVRFSGTTHRKQGNIYQ